MTKPLVVVMLGTVALMMLAVLVMHLQYRRERLEKERAHRRRYPDPREAPPDDRGS